MVIFLLNSGAWGGQGGALLGLVGGARGQNEYLTGKPYLAFLLCSNTDISGHRETVDRLGAPDADGKVIVVFNRSLSDIHFADEPALALDEEISLPPCGGRLDDLALEDT
jgi:hypothetical protein